MNVFQPEYPKVVVLIDDGRVVAKASNIDPILQVILTETETEFNVAALGMPFNNFHPTPTGMEGTGCKCGGGCGDPTHYWSSVWRIELSDWALVQTGAWFSLLILIVMGIMKIKFNKQITVDFLDHRGCDAQEDEVTEKTFYHNQIVEIERTEESARGFVDLIFENGDIAIGCKKEGLTIL